MNWTDNRSGMIRQLKNKENDLDVRLDNTDGSRMSLSGAKCRISQLIDCTDQQN